MLLGAFSEVFKKETWMIHLDRVALEIKNVGLYDLVLQDVQNLLGKKRLDEREIRTALETHPKILEDYKQINVEYNVSNIHLRDIDTRSLEGADKVAAEAVNANLAELREIEKYTLDFEQSSTLVIIFSIEFIVLFSVQYFIILLDLKEWQWELYTLFGSSVGIAWWYAKKQQRLYERQNALFEKKYVETLELIDDLESRGAIRKDALIIEECEEHV